MPRYRYRKSVIETTEEITEYEATVSARTPAEAENKARFALKDEEWEEITSYDTGVDTDESYDLLETLPDEDGEPVVHGTPADYGLAQPNLLSAAQEEETKA